MTTMMKAKDLKADLDWTVSAEAGRYSRIAGFLTEAWLAEPKLDGVRSKVVLGGMGSQVTTWRRDVSGNFPHMAGVAIPDLDGTVLDGEIIAPVSKLQTPNGAWTDSLLNASVALTNSGADKAVAAQQGFGNAQFWAFDVLAVAGKDVTAWSFEKRRAALETVVKVAQAMFPDCEIHLVPQFEASVDVIEESIANGFEGVMLKKKTAPYSYGKRSDAWLKVKRYSTADGFIVGYKPGANGRSGKVGSVEVAVTGDSGEVIAVASLGNLDAGLQDAMSAADGSLKDEWYGVCVEWMAQGIGKNGRARHPHLVRIRPDKSPEECTKEQLSGFARV